MDFFEQPSGWFPNDPLDASSTSPAREAGCWMPVPWAVPPPTIDLGTSTDDSPAPSPAMPGYWQPGEGSTDGAGGPVLEDLITGLMPGRAPEALDPGSDGGSEPWTRTCWELLWNVIADPGTIAEPPIGAVTVPPDGVDLAIDSIDPQDRIPRIVICEPCPYPPLPCRFWDTSGVPSAPDGSTAAGIDLYAISTDPEDLSLCDWTKASGDFSGDFSDDLWICVLPPPLWRPTPRGGVPADHPSQAWDDDVHRAYQAFLRENPTWEEEHGAGGIQLQVITASTHQPWIQLSTPGAARAFDAWFERNVMAVRGGDAGSGDKTGAPDDDGSPVQAPDWSGGREWLNPSGWSGSSSEPPWPESRPSLRPEEGSSDQPEPDTAPSTRSLSVPSRGPGAAAEPAGATGDLPAVLVLAAASSLPAVSDRGREINVPVPAAEAVNPEATDLFEPDRSASVVPDPGSVEGRMASSSTSDSSAPATAHLDGPAATAWLLLRQQKLVALPAWLLRPLRPIP